MFMRAGSFVTPLGGTVVADRGCSFTAEAKHNYRI